MQQLLILGRATKDAEVLESKEGKEYGRFTVVVNEYRGKDKEEVASYFNVLVFGKTVKRIDKIQKGDYVMVEGRPEADPYLSNDGEAKANLTVFTTRWRVLK